TTAPVMLAVAAASADDPSPKIRAYLENEFRVPLLELKYIDRRIVPVLIEQARSKDVAARRSALLALGALRVFREPGSMEALLAAVHATEASVRLVAVTTMGDVLDELQGSDETVGKQLMTALADALEKDPAVRERAGMIIYATGFKTTFRPTNLGT